MPLLVMLLVAGAVVFIVIGRIGLRSPSVQSSSLRQFGLFVLASVAAAATVIVLGLLILQQSFRMT